MVIKVFERLVLTFLKAATDHQLDPLLFTYRTKRSVDNAAALGLIRILRQLNPPTSSPIPTDTYARVLTRCCCFVCVCVECNSQRKLFDKLIHMGVERSLCMWVLDFPQDNPLSDLAGEPPRRSPSTSVPPLPSPPPAPRVCALASAVVIVHSVSSDPSVLMI